MRFYTRELVERGQEIHRRWFFKKGLREWEREWKEAGEEYGREFESIAGSLPEGMRKLCETSLHDGLIKAVSRTGDELVLDIDGSECVWGPKGQFKLVFRGVRSAEGAEDIVGDWWLYEEVHLCEMSRFEYHVLLRESELVVAADDVELIKIAESPEDSD